MIRVLVNGANGKMGQLAVKTVEKASGLMLVAATGRQDNLAEKIIEKKADVVVDLTNAESASKNMKIIIEAGAHPVIGTTGFVEEEVNQFKKICAELKLGGIIAPNFSLGAVLLMKYAQEFVKYFPDVEIMEMHHPGKLDSPSGTAVLTAELLAKSCLNPPSHPVNVRETVPGARGACYKNIPIHAVRLPGLVAHLQIMFGGVGETVTLRHDSIDRQCFMPGIVLSCKKVVELKELVYGLENIL